MGVINRLASSVMEDIDIFPPGTDTEPRDSLKDPRTEPPVRLCTEP